MILISATVLNIIFSGYPVEIPNHFQVAVADDITLRYGRHYVGRRLSQMESFCHLSAR